MTTYGNFERLNFFNGIKKIPINWSRESTKLKAAFFRDKNKNLVLNITLCVFFYFLNDIKILLQ